jgi:hypothetical protein
VILVLGCLQVLRFEMLLPVPHRQHDQDQFA